MRVTIMGFKLNRVHVWAAEVLDQAGGVAGKLALLAQAGANLEFIYTRRNSEKPGTGVLYVAPITGPLQQRAARSAGLHEVGLGHKVTQGWAMAGLTLQGLNMSVLGGKFVGYASFDSVQDANRAAAILGDLGAHPPVVPTN
jgi:hypothetical protein